MTEWFESTDFWVDLYPYMFKPETFERAGEEVRLILELIGVDTPRVLDLCCGPGRHAVAMAQAGHEVTGVDLTPFLLERARERAAEAGVDIEWIQADMREFVRPGAFELCINMFTAFGYFDDKDEDLLVLENIHASLAPGGVLLMDVVGKERLARIFSPTTSEELPGESVLVQRHEIFDDWTRIRNEWILIKDGVIKTFEFHHTLYSGQELKERMFQAGFESVALYGDLAGDLYDTNAKRLVAVARKGA